MSTSLKVAFIFCVTFFVFLTLVYFSFFHLAALKVVNPGVTAMMLERGGEMDQTWVPLSRISPFLRKALVLAEDGTFYQHSGIDYHETEEAFKKNLKKGKFSRGFSTITMQVARNLYLSRSKTITRKALEILIAWRLERTLSKNRILEIYLNIIEWGQGIYGAEAASRYYFHKPAADLNTQEAAFLAAIIPSPVRWGHWPPGDYIQNRMERIQSRM